MEDISKLELLQIVDIRDRKFQMHTQTGFIEKLVTLLQASKKFFRIGPVVSFERAMGGASSAPDTEPDGTVSIAFYSTGDVRREALKSLDSLFSAAVCNAGFDNFPKRRPKMMN